MKSKIVKSSIVIFILLVLIVLYKLPIISLWRNYNNGISAFNERNYNQAATEFSKTIALSDDPILKYNRCISLWSDVMKKQQDLKINTINDTSITTFDKEELLSKVKKTHHAIDKLINLQKLNNRFLAKLYYAQGKLYLFEGYPDSAKRVFQTSTSKDKNFIPPHVELVKFKTSDELDQTSQLLLNISKIEPIDVVRGWKPF